MQSQQRKVTNIKKTYTRKADSNDAVESKMSNATLRFREPMSPTTAIALHAPSCHVPLV